MFFVPLSVHAEATRLCYLIDTSARVSVIPVSYIDRRSGATTDPLQAANGCSIATYDTRNASLWFGGRLYRVRFVIVMSDVRF